VAGLDEIPGQETASTAQFDDETASFANWLE
jgi:hypothetical protein